MAFLSNNIISEFLVSVINFMQSGIGMYAVTIILLTIIIRLAMLPLDLKQRKNARKMQSVNPEIEGIKKRYGANTQQTQLKIQELYKERGISPLAGCLPLVIQLPILFAFFGALRVIASEQTLGILFDVFQNGPENLIMPTFLWIQNFWQPDSAIAPIFPAVNDFLSFIKSNMSYLSPETLSLLHHDGILSFSNNNIVVNAQVYEGLTNSIIQYNNLQGYNNGMFILPALAGATLFIQQKLTGNDNPQMNNKMMLFLFPAFSVYICVTSTAAFALYWTTVNIYVTVLTILVNKHYKKKQLLLEKQREEAVAIAREKSKQEHQEKISAKGGKKSFKKSGAVRNTAAQGGSGDENHHDSSGEENQMEAQNISSLEKEEDSSEIVDEIDTEQNNVTVSDYEVKDGDSEKESYEDNSKFIEEEKQKTYTADDLIAEFLNSEQGQENKSNDVNKQKPTTQKSGSSKKYVSKRGKPNR